MDSTMPQRTSRKRKLEQVCSSTPSKKVHQVQFEDSDYASQSPEDFSASVSGSDIHDPRAAFTLAGAPRAPSEANRLWNYICPYENCGQRFNRPCRLENHIRTHTKERPYACLYDECDKTFTRKDHLERHIASAHRAGPKFDCKWDGCEKSFNTSLRLRRHEETHEAKERFRCRDYSPCNETFRKHSTLQAHIKMKHLKVKAFPCTHVDEVTGQTCTSAYDTEPNLNRHIGSVHGGNRYFCTICVPEDESVNKEERIGPSAPVGFPTYPALQSHITEAHPPICTHCGLKCATKNTLRAHIEIAHEAPPGGIRLFPCPNPGCDRSFTRRGNLSVHVQTVHNKIKRFICGQFDLSDSSIVEIRTWNGEGACGQAFAVKSTLEGHIRTQHLGLGKNRKEMRKNARKSGARSKRKTGPSALSMLTGVGYEDSGRDISCLVQGCIYRFKREYDLRVHLASMHSLSEELVDEMMTERDALQGGEFWIGGSGDQHDGNGSQGRVRRQSYRGVDTEGNDNTRKESSDYQYPYAYDIFAAEEADDEILDYEMGITGMSKTEVHDSVNWDASFHEGYGMDANHGTMDTHIDDNQVMRAMMTYLHA